MGSVAKAPQISYISAEEKTTIEKVSISSLSIKKEVVVNQKKILGEYITQYGQNDILVKLADCESSYRNICVIDTNGKLSCGMFQFQYDTFKRYCTGNWRNGLDQTRCADSMIKQGLGRDNWTVCWNKINL